MIHILWEFHVKPQCRAEFERRYSPAGCWAQFFAKGQGYRGTLLLRDASDDAHYITVDRWDDAACYDTFRATHLAEYQTVDQECGALTESERHIGTFEEL